MANRPSGWYFSSVPSNLQCDPSQSLQQEFTGSGSNKQADLVPALMEQLVRKMKGDADGETEGSNSVW